MGGYTLKIPSLCLKTAQEITFESNLRGCGMGAVKGLDGRGLADNIRSLMSFGKAYRYSALKKRVKKRGYWSDQAICQYFMSYVVNLPASRDRWPGLERAKTFLFLRGDGRYELYDSNRHPKILE